MTEADELLFVPLGGSGEIGMNLNLYGYGPRGRRQWIMLDCGVTFGDLSTPGVDVIMPDPAFIEERRHDLLAIVLTHAHEDHMGAVAHLWPRLKAPVYATPFTAWLVRDRLREAGLIEEVEVREIPLDARFTIGPFDLQLVTITHSIPEPNGVIVRTPAGAVLHTGDWKLDPDPMIGEPTDIEALRAVGEEGVLAMVCDSTNVFVEGESGSEGDVRAELIKAVSEETGKVAVAAFASNVARLESAVLAAVQNDRAVCLVGRSMHRMAAAAQAVGLLKGVKFVSEEEAGFMPGDKILYICTGSQGEPRAALTRIAEDTHRHVTLGKGDTVFFSSRVIPGNDTLIFELQNKLADRGVKVVTDKDRPIHVSGHPARDELRQMYQWARPRIAVPVHGERRHLLAHAELAREMQVKTAIAPRNGDVVRLAPGPAKVVDEAPAGRLYLDGDFIVPAGADALRERKKAAFNGFITVAFAVNDKGRIIDGPDIRAHGLPENDDTPLDAFLDDAADAAADAFKRLSRADKADEEAAEEMVARSVRKLAQALFGKRPIVDAVILRV